MKTMGMACAGAVLLAAGSAAAAEPSQVDELNRLADRSVAMTLQYDPTISYFTGLPAPDHRRWADRSAAGIARYEKANDALHAELDRIDPKRLPDGIEQVTYALLKEGFEAERQSRVCRSELWAVSHMAGWQINLPSVAKEQPVGTADERAQALERWSAVPAFVDTEIANLRRGLKAGYSSPKTVVARTLKQVEGLASGAPETSPLYSPAERATDAGFKTAYRAVLTGKVQPALRRYAEFLKTEYMPKARDSLGVSAHPNGVACYQASLRSYTTLNRTPQEVHDLGERTVSANMATVQDLGQKTFGTREVAEIQKRLQEAPDNRFKSEDELVGFSREVVQRAKGKSEQLFVSVPSQEVKVEPFEAFMRGSGASSFYDVQVDPAKPAYYRIATESWDKETRGGAEITAVHEAYPGHHMQIAFARTLPQTNIAKLSFNSAYVEGWARYAEMLAEEAGIYGSDYPLISRRMWPARGMVADPGLHVLGWTREQTRDYLLASGRFAPKDTEDLIDRMAIMPGQLTAYDSGGLEIMALREQAKRELGARFDLKAFHKTVLELGVVPLAALREHVQAWIAREKAAG